MILLQAPRRNLFQNLRAALQQSTVNIYMDMQGMHPFGGTGDALFASRDKGETIFNRMVDFVAAFIEQFKKMDPRARTNVSDCEP